MAAAAAAVVVVVDCAKCELILLSLPQFLQSELTLRGASAALPLCQCHCLRDDLPTRFRLRLQRGRGAGHSKRLCRQCSLGRAARTCCHVTRHTSHVTRHTSHVTRHTSHVTLYTSHVTRHTLHVTRHTSHVTFTSHPQRATAGTWCAPCSSSSSARCDALQSQSVTRRASHCRQVDKHLSLEV